VTADEVYRQAEKRNVQTPVLWFRETKKGLVLSRTNRNALAQAFGDDAAKCIGRKIVLKLTPMRVAGRDMEVIRVHVPSNGTQQQTQAQQDAPGYPVNCLRWMAAPLDKSCQQRSDNRKGQHKVISQAAGLGGQNGKNLLDKCDHFQ
jgi:hypothetical protein